VAVEADFFVVLMTQEIIWIGYRWLCSQLCMYALNMMIQNLQCRSSFSTNYWFVLFTYGAQRHLSTTGFRGVPNIGPPNRKKNQFLEGKNIKNKIKSMIQVPKLKFSMISEAFQVQICVQGVN
jgi:hypothetical protein